jgi:hypothetical protein
MYVSRDRNSILLEIQARAAFSYYGETRPVLNSRSFEWVAGVKLVLVGIFLRVNTGSTL